MESKSTATRQCSKSQKSPKHTETDNQLKDPKTKQPNYEKLKLNHIRPSKYKFKSLDTHKNIFRSLPSTITAEDYENLRSLFEFVFCYSDNQGSYSIAQINLQIPAGRKLLCRHVEKFFVYLNESLVDRLISIEERKEPLLGFLLYQMVLKAKDEVKKLRNKNVEWMAEVPDFVRIKMKQGITIDTLDLENLANFMPYERFPAHKFGEVAKVPIWFWLGSLIILITYGWVRLTYS